MPTGHLLKCMTKRCQQFDYLGVAITPSGNFRAAIKNLCTKATRAYYAKRQQINHFNGAKPETLSKLFDMLVTPIILYGSEAWGFSIIENMLHFNLSKFLSDFNKPWEMLHTKFYREAPGLINSPPT